MRPEPLSSGKPLRSDALRNRDLIVSAAAQLFAERGLTVPLEDVARAAGVGVATLYRRFPTRSELAIAVFERNMSSYIDVVEKALANSEPWDSFRNLAFDLCALQASDPGMRAILTTEFPPSSLIERQANQMVEKVGEVMTRAQADGALRPDVVVGDVVVMLLANAGVVEATREHAPDAWRRFAAMMVDSMRVGSHRELPDPTPPQQLRRSIGMVTGERIRPTL